VSRFDAWAYCPVCDCPLGPGAHGAARACPRCGFEVYDNPAPTATALVVRDGMVMLTRRANEPQAGWWDLPGGFMEPGETPEQTVVRELAEETGLSVEVGELVGVFPDAYGETGIPTINLFYRATVAGGEELPADDVSEIGWFEPASIDPSSLAFDCCRNALVTFVRKS
jgi:ADP-ribose pyrophosphatase YjhB (NUDIX family)